MRWGRSRPTGAMRRPPEALAPPPPRSCRPGSSASGASENGAQAPRGLGPAGESGSRPWSRRPAARVTGTGARSGAGRWGRAFVTGGARRAGARGTAPERAEPERGPLPPVPARSRPLFRALMIRGGAGRRRLCRRGAYVLGEKADGSEPEWRSRAWRWQEG